MIRPDTVRPALLDVEVTPKAACGEAIRAVRVILGRSKPVEADGPVGRPRPVTRSELAVQGV